MSTPAPPPPPTGPAVPDAPPAPVAPTPSPMTRDEKPTLLGLELAAVIVAGFLVNIGVRIGVGVVATVAAVLVIGAALLVGGRIEQRSAQWLVVGAMSLAPWMMIRSSDGLLLSTMAAVATFLLVAAGLSRVGELGDLNVRTIVEHHASQAVEWVYGIEMVSRWVRTRAEDAQGAAVMRGVAIALPVLIVFGLLLASADEVFASFLFIGNRPSAVGHALATGFFAIVLLGLVSRAAHRTEPRAVPERTTGMAALELTIILGSLAALFAAFVGTQIAVAIGGVDHVLETEGLTQAEHARSGFFQLLWVAALALGLLGALRALRALKDEGGRDPFRPLALTVLALTLVITAISAQRLLLYVGSFDFTPLRFWALAATGWVGVVIVAYMASVAGVRSGRSWFPAFMLLSAGAFVFGMNVVNPDGFVARYNLEHQSAASVDVAAIARLSDDAVLASINGLPTLPTEERIEFAELLCARQDLERQYGLLGQNRAHRHADWLLDKFCPNPRPQARADEFFD